MSEQTKTILKTYFETGDTPTEAQFVDLIDTLVTETSASILDASIVRVDGLISTNVAEIAQLDASIVRVDGLFSSAYTGSFLTLDGSTATVVNGLITAVTP